MVIRRVFFFSGLIFFLAGILLSFNSLQNITGYSVLETINSKPSAYLGLWFILSGLFLGILASSSHLEQLVSASQFGERISSSRQSKPSGVLVLDTSAVIPYSVQEISALISKEKKAGYEVLIPDTVLAEVKDLRKRNTLANLATEIIHGNIKDKYSNAARSLLEKSEKFKFYKTMSPLVEKALKNPDSLNEVEKAQLTRGIRYLAAGSKGEDANDIKYGSLPLVLRKVKQRLDATYKVSQTDVDVLATAIEEARYGKNVIIGQRDRDFEDAINNLKSNERYKMLAERIHYVNPNKQREVA